MKKQQPEVKEPQEEQKKKTKKKEKKEHKLKEEEYQTLLKDSEELKSTKEKLLRTMADFENSKKRLEKQKEEFIQFANKRILTDSLPIIDNLERAIESARANHSVDSLIEGVEMIEKQLLGVLKNHGLEKLSTIGKPFDPNHHEAIGTIPSDEYEEDTVVEEMSAGYLYKGVLLKPTMVRISTKTEKSEE